MVSRHASLSASAGHSCSFRGLTRDGHGFFIKVKPHLLQQVWFHHPITAAAKASGSVQQVATCDCGACRQHWRFCLLYQPSCLWRLS